MLGPFRAHDFVVNVQGDLIDNSSMRKIGPGLKILLEASYPEATHDSSSHPTSCFPGTRLQYIEDITGWALASATNRYFPMMWMSGPAGAGKSSLAQACAEKLGNKLAATFFFSRPNSRNVSTRFFPSIAYQLATKYPAYRDKLEERICRDPTLVHKSVTVQFRELIATPLQELKEEGQSVSEGVIFIDGLDECAGEDTQCTIIDTISVQVRDRSFPFIWAFFSRPEPLIVEKFASPEVRDLCWQLTLPVSRDADTDIELYLRDGFRRIRAQNGIPSAVSWPSKDDIRELVQKSAGLFIYPASVLRFVGEGGELGPEEQLRLVLQLPSKLTSNPWSHLDVFYTLIMEQIPKNMLPNALKLLRFAHLRDSLGYTYNVAADVLGLSPSTFYAALSKLHSVVKVVHTDAGLPNYITFYHASFTDFLKAPERSGKFCVQTPEICAILLADVIGRLDRGFDDDLVRQGALGAFWEFGSYAKLDENLLQQLSQFNFLNMPMGHCVEQAAVNRLFNNIPPPWRRKIMRPYQLPLWQKLSARNDLTKSAFVLGRGSKKCELAFIPTLNVAFCRPCALPGMVQDACFGG